MSFIVFQINKMNSFSINFSPLKNEFLRKNEFGLDGDYGFQVVLKIMCTWVFFFFQSFRINILNQFSLPKPICLDRHPDFCFFNFYLIFIFFIGHQFRSCFKYVVFDVIVRGGVNRAVVTIASGVGCWIDATCSKEEF